MNRKIIIASLAASLLSLTACGVVETTPSADQNQAAATQKMAAEADASVGMPAIKNWTEKKLARDIYELRDDPKLTTFAYVQGLDGKLHCLGRAQGYGLPYSTQFSNPQRVIDSGDSVGNGYGYLPQAEPNGLFIPEGLSATWLKLIDPKTGKPTVVYVEPTITVSPFELTGPVVASAC